MKELNMPNHIGIIMDGNGRWATKRGLPRSAGHKAGAENLKKLCKHINKLGLNYLSLFAFSTENFNRDPEEVNYLMDLFVKYFTKKKKIFVKEELKVIFSGSKEHLRDDVLKGINSLEEVTKDFKRGTFNICLNYGGRLEIVDAFKKIYSDIEQMILTNKLSNNKEDIINYIKEENKGNDNN